MPDILSDRAYRQGVHWARENLGNLRELFTSEEVLTDELRRRLFDVAARAYPSDPNDVENDLHQTAWVAGALRPLIETVGANPRWLAVIFDTASEMGSIYNAEYWKMEAIRTLKQRPPGWWRKRLGDASPNDVLFALAKRWRREIASHKGRRDPKSKWEILIDTTGTREAATLAEAQRIGRMESGPYVILEVESPESSFEVIEAPADAQDLQRWNAVGDIVG